MRRQNRNKILLGIVITGIVLVIGISIYRGIMRAKEYVVCEHMQDRIVRVDGKDLTLEDAAFQILFTESNVQKQAVVYAPEEPVKYWRAHVNGKFLNLMVKDAIINAIVRDEILYTMACEDKVELTEEEKEFIKGEAAEYYFGLNEYQKKSLELTEEDIVNAMERLGLIEKYVTLISIERGCDVEDLALDGSEYKMILEGHRWNVYEKNWGRVKIGAVTLQENKL